MVSNTTALWFTLGGVVAGGLFGVIAAVTVPLITGRHERRMYWLEQRRRVFAELVASATEYQRATNAVTVAAPAFAARRRQLPASLLENLQVSMARFRLASGEAELFAVGPMDEARKRVHESGSQVAGWLYEATGGQAGSSIDQANRKAPNMDTALIELHDSRLALIKVCRETLGIKDDG